jgi:Cu(I)/Ag(I) efflux system membrane protein CusA/SilA
MMTVLTVIIGHIPMMYGSGTGSEVMQRIAAPKIGGMASAVLLTLLVLHAIYKLWTSKEIRH